uniref:EKC/KEOPS complex subunit GON7 n=1 Tax=Strongyloides papillosus TaxID=174720 RepID=A0A0N5BTA4_STREA
MRDENASSSIFKRQISSLQEIPTSSYKPHSISQDVTNEGKSNESNRNDLNANVERVEMCIGTDITIPVTPEETSDIGADNDRSAYSLKRIMDHYKELVVKIRDEVDRKKGTVLELENQLQEAKSVRDEFLAELQSLLDEGGDGESPENVSSEVECANDAEDETADEE